MIEANWLIFAAVLVIALFIVWWLFGRASKPTVRERRPDVLDEGATPAQRNQALIDAPPAAAVPPPVVTPPAAAGTFAGVGEAVARAAREEAEAAEAHAQQADEPLPPPSDAAHDASAPASPPTSTPAPAPAPAPAAAPAPAPASAPGGSESGSEADDLRRIKGIGPKLANTLQALGITRYAQIAALTDADLDQLDAQLGAFAGRPRRDSWIEQARLLSSGDTVAYEAKFGKL
ncbi:hypothetical protein [Novosphingobium sp. M1R2S20]|uniref:Flap endonuclease-1-like 5' DNA nuclease n=1 Tax=Novosphingobium rhizovicinum TaxID=3228928 RepID=A0ABV3RCV8_9SPHN